MPTITMLRSEYESLLSLAQQASRTGTLTLRASIDTANGIERFPLQIRWKDVGGRPPARLDMFQGWPAQETAFLELERPVTRNDVDALLRTRAVNPAVVMVTPDPDGIVGWTFLDDYTF